MNTSWAASVFDLWVAHHNEQSSEKCPTSLLTIVHPTDTVDYWLATFILEAQRKPGEVYPLNTIRNILTAIFRHTKVNLGPNNVRIVVDKKKRESVIHIFTMNATDGYFKQLVVRVLVYNILEHNIITLEEENGQWAL